MTRKYKIFAQGGQFVLKVRLGWREPWIMIAGPSTLTEMIDQEKLYKHHEHMHAYARFNSRLHVID